MSICKWKALASLFENKFTTVLQPQLCSGFFLIFTQISGLCSYKIGLAKKSNQTRNFLPKAAFSSSPLMFGLCFITQLPLSDFSFVCLTCVFFIEYVLNEVNNVLYIIARNQKGMACHDRRCLVQTWHLKKKKKQEILLPWLCCAAASFTV